jgi:hypothetical protein
MTSLIVVTPGVKNLQGIDRSIKVPKIQTHSLVNWGTGSVIDIVAKFTESTSSTLGILYENNYTIGIINGLEELIKILPSTTKTIDLLTCNINKQNDIDQIKSLEKTYNITIRYSVDLTGHPDSMGNWILESHNVSVRDKYFNNMITEWKHVFASETERMNWILLNTTTSPSMTNPSGKSDAEIIAEINTITSITINANVTEIPDMTFDNRIPNVTSITTATDENGNSTSSLTRIGNQTFMGQPAAGVTCDVNIVFNTAEDGTIGRHAFYQRKIGTLSIQNTSGTYSIGPNAFDSAPIQVLDLKPAISSIGEGAFMMSELDATPIDLNLSFNVDGDTIVPANLCMNRTLQSLSISNIHPTGTYSIGNNAFLNTEIISNLTLGNGLSGIGNHAFIMSTLSSYEINVTIEFNVSGDAVIGERAFFKRKMNKLSIQNTSGTYSIDAIAFGSVPIQVLDLKPGISTIGDSAFMMSELDATPIDVSLLFNVDGDTIVPANLCMNRTLNSVSISNVHESGTYSIGPNAFYDTEILSYLTLENGLTGIGEGAFMISTLSSYEINITITFNMAVDGTIGRHAFYQRKIGTLTIQNTLGTYSIGNETFYDTPIKVLDLKPAISSIGVGAFMMSSPSQNEIDVTITFNMAVDGTIGRHAFYQRKIGTLTIQNTLGTYSIDAVAFYDTPIKVLDLKPAISSIGDDAFMMSGPDATPIDVSLSFDVDGPVAVSANLFRNRTLQSLSINRIEHGSRIPDGMIDGDYLSSSENLTNKIVLGTSKSVILSNTNTINNTKFLNVTFNQNSIQYLQNKSVVLIDCTIEN